MYLVDLATRATFKHLDNSGRVLMRMLAELPPRRVMDLRPIDVLPGLRGFRARGVGVSCRS